MHREIARVAAVAIVATLVFQGMAAGVMVGAEPTRVASQEMPDDPLTPADEIYVEGDGDVVAVYDDSGTTGDVNRTEFGVDVSENLAYFRMTDPVTGEPDVTGGFSAFADRTSVAAEGNVSTARPEALESFEFDASGVTNEDTSRADLSLSTTILDESGMSQAIRSGTTNGSIAMTADRLTASGKLDVRTEIPIPQRSQESVNVSLREDGGEYVLSVEQSRVADPTYRPIPESRSEARELLAPQFQAVARQFGGSATLDLHEYDVSEAGSMVRLDRAYTVRFQGIDEGLTRQIRRQLQRNPDVTAAQAEQLASAVDAVQIDQLDVRYEVDGGGVTGSANVEVGNYASLVTSYLDVVASMESESTGEIDVERVRKRLDAQRAADLERRFTWSGNLSHPDSQSVSAAFAAHASTTNWAEYVDELQVRDVPVIESRYRIEGGVTEDAITFEGNASLSGERLYEELFRFAPSEAEASPKLTPLLGAFRDSRPEKAKLVTAYDADGLHVEAGAAFGNLSVLRDALHETTGVPAASEVVGRANQQSGEAFVRVPDATGEQPSKASVRSLTYVDEGTTIHMPGDWDREFPSMDVERAEAFLEDPRSTSSGPGFGPIAALVAIVGAGFLLARRD